MLSADKLELIHKYLPKGFQKSDQNYEDMVLLFSELFKTDIEALFQVSYSNYLLKEKFASLIREENSDRTESNAKQSSI